MVKYAWEILNGLYAKMALIDIYLGDSFEEYCIKYKTAAK